MPCIRPGVEVPTAAPLHRTLVNKNTGLPKIRFIKGTEAPESPAVRGGGGVRPGMCLGGKEGFPQPVRRNKDKGECNILSLSLLERVYL